METEKNIYLGGGQEKKKVYHIRHNQNPSPHSPITTPTTTPHPPPPLSPGTHSKGISAICNADATGCPGKNELHLLPVLVRIYAFCPSLFASFMETPFSYSLPPCLYMSIRKDLEKKWRVLFELNRFKFSITIHCM